MSEIRVPVCDILDAISLDDDCAAVELTPDWSQGRAIYGGLVTAIALRAARLALLHHDPAGGQRPLRSLLVHFVGPTAPGLVELEVSILRRGRAATQVEVRLYQGEEVRAIVLAHFGESRASAVQVAGPPRPRAPSPMGLNMLPHVEGVTPAFLVHVDLRWTEGGAPFTGARESGVGGHCRLLDPAPAAEELIVMLADAWPSPALPLLHRTAPASSVTWSLELPTAILGHPRDYWYYSARVTAAADGYAISRAHLWAPSGQLAAVSSQSVAIFA